LLQVTNPKQDSVSYTYDASQNRDSISDHNGNITYFTYDERGNVTSTTEPDDPEDPNDGGVTTVEYTDPGCPDLPTRKTDALGFVTKWVYDINCNVSDETRYLDLAQTESVTRSWDYNAYGQRRFETNGRGFVHEWIYDPDGLLTEEIDREGNHTWYEHDELWRRTEVTDGRGSGAGDTTYTTVYTYDDADRLLTVTSPPVGATPHNITTSYGYDDVGNRIRVTDGRGNITKSYYDNNNNLEKVEEPLDGDPLGRVTRYGYDELNRKVSMTDANLNETTYLYDDADRLEEKQDAEGNIWAYTYDAQGNLLTETDPSGVTLTNDYDAQNRKTAVLGEEGGEWTAEYDRSGRVTSKTDANNNETAFTYDGLGRLTCVVDDAAGSTEYLYDEAGNLLEIQDANHNLVIVLDYDNLDRLISAEDGNGNIYLYGYDAVGNQTSVRDANLSTTTMTYDAMNRLTIIDYPDMPDVTHGYDDNGNRVSMIDANGTSSYVYDELNRLRSSTDSNSKVVEYDYDPVGNSSSITYPTVDSKQVVYDYDAANRLTRVTDWAGRQTDYLYDGMRIHTVTFPNLVVETHGYDLAGRLISKDTANSLAVPLLNLGWTRDNEGNPTQAAETGTLLPTLTAETVDYSYDLDNRLKSANTVSYVYDNNGNLTSRSVGGSTTDFTYDNEDRLTLQTDGIDMVQHVYDGDGNRVSKIENGATTHYVLDLGSSMSRVLCETNALGDITAYYIYGHELLTRIGAGFSERHYHTNDIGTVVALTDDNGLITDRYAYTPFGHLREHDGSTTNPFTFVGGHGVTQEAHDLFFMRARFYDPETGRFLGKDPVEGVLQDPRTLHRYAYGLNSPTVYADPNGEFVLLPVISWVATHTVAAHALAGASGGLMGSLAAGIATGNLEPNDFIGATVGGAVSGMLSFGNPVPGPQSEAIAGAIGAGFGSVFQQSLEILLPGSDRRRISREEVMFEVSSGALASWMAAQSIPNFTVDPVSSAVHTFSTETLASFYQQMMKQMGLPAFLAMYTRGGGMDAQGGAGLNVPRIDAINVMRRAFAAKEMH
jgi:RHS repeat-associated protein